MDCKGPFDVCNRTIRAAHACELCQSSANEREPLYLSMKQYIPRRKLAGDVVAVTVIAEGCVGFPKEAYEPFFEDLYHELQGRQIDVRSIWIADPVNHVTRAVRNFDNLGNPTYWFDHSRDLPTLLKHLRRRCQLL